MVPGVISELMDCYFTLCLWYPLPWCSQWSRHALQEMLSGWRWEPVWMGPCSTEWLRPMSVEHSCWVRQKQTDPCVFTHTQNQGTNHLNPRNTLLEEAGGEQTTEEGLRGHLLQIYLPVVPGCDLNFYYQFTLSINIELLSSTLEVNRISFANYFLMK